MGNLSQDIKPEQRPFFKVFEKIAYRHQYSEVFDDYLTMMVNWFANGVDETRQRRDQALAKYTPDEKQLFNEMMKEHMQLMYKKTVEHGDKWYDSLGDFYQTITSNWKSSAMGQFFTPESVVDMLVALTAHAEPYQMVSDPACGSGRMLLATHALQPLNYYHGIDLDAMCVKMTVVNMCLHNCSGVVSHGNTLTMEYYGAYFIDRVQTKAGWLPIVKVVSQEQGMRILDGLREYCRIMRGQPREKKVDPDHVAAVIDVINESRAETPKFEQVINSELSNIRAEKPEQLTLF